MSPSRLWQPWMAERYGIQEWDMARLTMGGLQRVHAVAEAEAAEGRKRELAEKARRARGEV